jgi:hypothetical protein
MLNKRGNNGSRRGNDSTLPKGYRDYGEGIRVGGNWQIREEQYGTISKRRVAV